ncbi:MAG: SCO family protein [Bacteroidota bacterium]|nr:SCO family protein [Bacteroidota bacterium]
MKNTKTILVIVAIVGIGFFLYNIWQKNNVMPIREIPVLGDSGHVVKPFSFINQDGKIVTQNDLKGKVYVVEYFFTTCQSICVPMGQNMMKVDSAFKDRNDFMILSHTVDPETDSVDILKQYAEAHHSSKNWMFLTGTQRDLYTTAAESYLLDSPARVKSPEYFLHTKFFMLVDKQGHLRGDAYDGTDLNKVYKLIEDAKMLLRD